MAYSRGIELARELAEKERARREAGQPRKKYTYAKWVPGKPKEHLVEVEPEPPEPKPEPEIPLTELQRTQQAIDPEARYEVPISYFVPSYTGEGTRIVTGSELLEHERQRGRLLPPPIPGVPPGGQEKFYRYVAREEAGIPHPPGMREEDVIAIQTPEGRIGYVSKETHMVVTQPGGTQIVVDKEQYAKQQQFEIEREALRSRIRGEEGLVPQILEGVRFGATPILDLPNFLRTVGIIGEDVFETARQYPITTRPGEFLQSLIQKGPESAEQILDIMTEQQIKMQDKDWSELFLQAYEPGGFGFLGTLIPATVGGISWLGAGAAIPGTGIAAPTAGPIAAKGLSAGIPAAIGTIAGADIGVTAALEEEGYLPPGSTRDRIAIYSGELAMALGFGYAATRPTAFPQPQFRVTEYGQEVYGIRKALFGGRIPYGKEAFMLPEQMGGQPGTMQPIIDVGTGQIVGYKPVPFREGMTTTQLAPGLEMVEYGRPIGMPGMQEFVPPYIQPWAAPPTAGYKIQEIPFIDRDFSDAIRLIEYGKPTGKPIITERPEVRIDPITGKPIEPTIVSEELIEPLSKIYDPEIMDLVRVVRARERLPSGPGPLGEYEPPQRGDIRRFGGEGLLEERIFGPAPISEIIHKGDWQILKKLAQPEGIYAEFETTPEGIDIKTNIYYGEELVPSKQIVGGKLIGTGIKFAPTMPGEFYFDKETGRLLGKEDILKLDKIKLDEFEGPIYIGPREAIDVFAGLRKMPGMIDESMVSVGRQIIPKGYTIEKGIVSKELFAEEGEFLTREQVPIKKIYDNIERDMYLFESKAMGKFSKTITETKGIGLTKKFADVIGPSRGYKMEVFDYRTAGITRADTITGRVSGKGKVYDLSDAWKGGLAKEQGDLLLNQLLVLEQKTFSIGNLASAELVKAYSEMLPMTIPELAKPSVILKKPISMEQQILTQQETKILSKSMEKSIQAEETRQLEKIGTEQIPITRQIEKSITTVITREMEKTVTKEMEKSIEKEETKQVEKTISRELTRQIEKTMTKQIEKQMEKQLEKQMQKQLEKQLEKQITKQIEKQLMKPLTQPIESLITKGYPVEPTTFLPLIEPPIESPPETPIVPIGDIFGDIGLESIIGGGSFHVFVKPRIYRQGRKVSNRGYDIKHTKHPYSYEDAIVSGADYVDKNEKASFKLVASKDKPHKLKKKPRNLFSVFEEFYEKPDDIFVEQSRSRIDSPGEIMNISRLGWEARRKGSRSKRVFPTSNIERKIEKMMKKVAF